MSPEVPPVEFFTQQYRVTGRLWSASQRLTDLLNDELASTLELRTVEVARLLAPEKVVASRDSALLEKRAILFAISKGEGAEAAVRSFYKHVRTKQWDVFVTLPCFELSGRLHLRGASDLRTMLLAWTGQFIPITEGKAVYTIYPEVSFSGEVIIVNRSRIEAVCADVQLLP